MADEENAAGEAPTENTSLQPPTYSGIRRELKEARSTGNTLSFCDKLCFAIAGTLWATLVLLVLTGIPIAMLAVGAIYLHDCPRLRYIPIWLIVFGVFAALKGLGIFIRRLVGHCRRDEHITWSITPFDGLVGCFMIIWFICGTLWVYSIYGDFSLDPASQDYCNQTVYGLAFCIITLAYMVFWIIGLAWCCVRVCFAAAFDPFWDKI